MDIQSLLFGRDAGWTEGKAKQWAQSHGYKSHITDVTDQYVRIRQFDPSGLKVKRTITLGRGIRAVVAREEDMKRRRTTKKSRSSRRTASAATAAKPAFGTPAWRAMYPRKGKSKRKAGRARETSPVVAAPKRRRARRVRAVAAPRRVRSTTVAAPRKRRHTRRVRAVAAPRRVRAVAALRRVRSTRATAVAAPRKRRHKRRHVTKAWFGNTPGHRKAAKKGHARKRKSARRVREMIVAAPRKRRSTRRRTREFTYAAAPKKRRHARRTRETSVVKSSRRRRSYRTHAVGGSVKRIGKHIGVFAAAIASAGVGYTLANGFDRFLATYNPSSEKVPTDKFTSGGAGTLANALNVASPPHLIRIGAAVGSILVPAVASAFVKNRYARASLEGLAVGAGVNAFSMLWNNVLMPMLAPKDASDVKKLQESFIARLYPAEVAAKMNLDTMTTAGALSGGPGAGVGAPDVGPFAVGGSSPYPDTAQALRRQAGLDGDSPYPSAGQALRDQAGVGYSGRPAPPVVNQWRGMHPSYQRNGAATSAAWSRRWGNAYQARYAVPAGAHHHHCMLRAKAAYPTYTDAQLHAWCQAHPHHTHPYLYEAPPVQTYTAGPALGDGPPDPPPADATPDSTGPGFTPAGPPPAPMPPAAAAPPADPVGPPVFQPGPGSGPGPGPVPTNQECGCVGESNNFLGFIGDAEEKELFFDSGK